MPKVLNVVKLHKKFATLTRTKESVQSLAGWIMHHGEFHEDIVNEWLSCLSKDYNALVMFYVANEVIQNCGKKRVPEFRVDFAKVLKKAASLEKVKIIKENVIRLLSFWKERDIYDENFSKEFETILNSQEIKVDSDDEPSEEEVIARFKKETLIADLEKLKIAIADREEKAEILTYADEPIAPDSSVPLVQRECQDMIEKCEKYVKLVEENINLACREVRVKRAVLEDLKDCCIFYSAQSRDVKEVANVFRIYGKKLKIMEKKVSEKKASFASTKTNSSPSCAGEMLSSPYSISSYASLSDNDSTSVFERSSKDSPEISFQDNKQQKSFFALLNPEGNSLSEGSISDAGIEKLEGKIKEQDSSAPQPNPEDSKAGDLNDIDFLLDESYDCKRSNPKPIKRKAEIRLKLKEKRVCTEDKRESSSIIPIIEPYKITHDEKMGDLSNMNTAEDVRLEVTTYGAKGNDSIVLESLLDKSKTKEIPSKEEAPLQKNELVVNDVVSSEKADKDKCVTVLEAPSQKDAAISNNELSNRKALKDDSVTISDALQHNKTDLEDKPSNEKADESDETILKAPSVEDKTVYNAKLPEEKDDKDSIILSTHTAPHLSSNTSKDGFDDSSATQKELASDSVPTDDLMSNADKTESKLSFENSVVPVETFQCSETLNTKTDSSVIQKSPKDEQNCDKPNLLDNLQKVLESICSNQFQHLQTSDSGKEPTVPLENYIAIYGALCCPVVKNLTEDNVSTPLQNEVVDMDCETDEES